MTIPTLWQAFTIGALFGAGWSIGSMVAQIILQNIVAIVFGPPKESHNGKR